jgi:hypothetical protein
MPRTTNKPVLPTLSPSEIASAQGDFISALERELRIRGEDSKVFAPILNALRSSVVVAPTFGGVPDVHLRAGAGRLRLRGAADHVVSVAAEQALIASHGPDPVALLRDRLLSLGVPSDEAGTIAATRVQRLPDGRVEALAADGRRLYLAPDPVTPHDAEGFPLELPPAERARVTDAKRALELATRDILSDRAPRLDAAAKQAVGDSMYTSL